MVLRVATLLLLGAVAALLWPAVQWMRQQPPPLPPATHLSFPPPSADVELGAGEELLDAAISPDEREIVFVATSGDIPRLWRRRLDADRAVVLAGTEGAQQPAWKPTGNVISFFAAGKLRQLSLPDGVVSDLADATTALGAAWMSDGSLIFATAPDRPLQRLQNGKLTTATRLRAGERGHVFPTSLSRRSAEGANADLSRRSAEGAEAEGFAYIAVRADGRRTVRVVLGEEERDLTTTSGHAQLVGGLLVHVQDGALLAQRFDAETGTLVGRGLPLGLNVGVSPNGRALMAASPRLVLFAASLPRPRELAWFDSNGLRTGTSGDPGDYRQIRLSPNDQHIAATILDPLLRTLDIFIVPSQGGGAERLTLALAADTDPVWSPDGVRVLFRSFLDGQPNLFTRRVGVRGAPEEPVLRSSADEIPSDWARLGPSDGQVLFSGSSSASSDVLKLDVAKGSQEALFNSSFNETDARWSPDRRWISYVSDESGQPDVYVSGWPEGRRARVSFGGGTRPRWSRDGRSLLFLRGSQVMRSERSDTGQAQFSAARQLLAVSEVRDFDVAHRTDRLLLLLPVAGTTNNVARAIIDWRAMIEN